MNSRAYCLLFLTSLYTMNSVACCQLFLPSSNTIDSMACSPLFIASPDVMNSSSCCSLFASIKMTKSMDCLPYVASFNTINSSTSHKTKNSIALCQLYLASKNIISTVSHRTTAMRVKISIPSLQIFCPSKYLCDNPGHFAPSLSWRRGRKADLSVQR